MTERRSLTYSGAGVDVEASDRAVRELAGVLGKGRTGLGAALGGAGSFAGLVDFGETALVLCTDGVGSKLEIANALGRWDTVGIDCIAMNVNDALCVGAEPLAFVDYLAVEEPDADLTREIGRGLARGADEANVTIVGGETAVLPDIVAGFDLAGTCLAHVPRSRIITGERVAPDDVLVGLASSGLHSNGYTLVRAILEEAEASLGDRVPGGGTLGETLLEPTRIYVRAVLPLLDAVDVHGLAHVTGGGLRNLPRMNPDVAYVLDEPLEPQPVFDLLQDWGNVATSEMYGTFNMGMGMVLAVAEDDVDAALEVLEPHVEARAVGHVESGAGTRVPSLGLAFEEVRF